MDGLTSENASELWARVIELCTAIYYAPAFRLFVVVVLILATIWAIAKVYSGELQNAEKGPVAIRRHKGTVGSIPRDTLVVHRDLISLTMDGCHARCTIMYVYEGYKNKRVHVPLLSKQVQINVSPSKLSDKVQGIARANEVPDVKQEEVFWPVLDLESNQPVIGHRTAESAIEYAAQQHVLERWSGDDELSLISTHEDLLEEITSARDEFIRTRVARVRRSKEGSWLQRMLNRGAAKERPGAVGNYYLKFQFSNDPLFVLARHPDRDVRMTAWLTLLTSGFALLMEVFPLQPTIPPGIAGAAAAPIDSAIQDTSPRGPRIRPPPR